MSNSGIAVMLFTSFFTFMIAICLASLSEDSAIERGFEQLGNASQLFNKLLTNYDNRDRPFVGQKQTEIKLSFGVVSFSGFKEAEMEFTMQLHLRQLWMDPRLAHDQNSSLTFHLQEDINKLWLPDIYIANAKKVVRDNLWLGIISPDGQVYFTYLATVVLNCKMEFVNYPMDKQVCPVLIESYGHTRDQIVYKWYQGGSVSVFDKNLAEFEVTDVKMIHDKTVQYISGPYSQLEVQFTFSRRMGYYLIQIYIPCLLIVITSWTIFWMDRYSVTDRAALGVSSVLSIVFLLGTSNSTMPRVSYIKAIDWFMIISFVFVFCAVIECVIVYKLEDKRNKRNKKKTVKKGAIKSFLENCLPIFRTENATKTEDNSHIIMNDHVNSTAPNGKVVILPLDDCVSKDVTNSTDCRRNSKNNEFIKQQQTVENALTDGDNKEMDRSVDCGHALDNACRVLFPLSYAMFNLGYWISYLNAYN